MSKNNVEKPGFKISTKKWHYKLIKFVLGNGAPTPQNMHNLCPYFWLLIFSMFASIFVVIAKVISKTFGWLFKKFDHFIDFILVEPSARSWFNDLSELDVHRLYTRDKSVSNLYKKSKQGKTKYGYPISSTDVVNKWYKKVYKQSIYELNEEGEEVERYTKNFRAWDFEQQNIRRNLLLIAQQEKRKKLENKTVDFGKFIDNVGDSISSAQSSMAEWKNIIKWTKRTMGALITTIGLSVIYVVVNFMGRGFLWLVENFNGPVVLEKLIMMGIILAIIAVVVGIILLIRLWLIYVADKGLKLWYAKIIFYFAKYVIFVPVKFIFVDLLWYFVLINLFKGLIAGTIMVKEGILGFLGIFGEYFGASYTDYCPGLEWEENKENE